MNQKIEHLCKLYKENKIEQKYRFDDSTTIEYNERDFDDYAVFISLNKASEDNLIFINIVKNKKIIYRGLLDKSIKDIKSKYKELMKDLKLLSLVEFINKYYEPLIALNV